MDASKRFLIGMLARPGFYRISQSALRRLLPAVGLGFFGTMEETGENLFLRTVAARLGPSPLVLDVGANRGDYAREIMRLRPDARLHAFEPNPVVFEPLSELSRSLGFEVHKVACAAAPGRAKLFVPQWGGEWASQLGSLSGDVAAGVFEAELQEHDVELIVLDDLLDAIGAERVDYIKIDVQGHELAVLHGLRRRLDAGKVDWLSFEFDQGMVFTRTFMYDFYCLLPGWRFFRIVRNGLADLGKYRPDRWENFMFQNIVAVRPGIALDGLPVLG